MWCCVGIRNHVGNSGGNRLTIWGINAGLHFVRLCGERSDDDSYKCRSSTDHSISNFRRLMRAEYEHALEAFDRYNSNDPNLETSAGIPKELMYARRMTDRLLKYYPQAPGYLQLAARGQHIGRWEISRSQYPMDKKGYFQWRNKLKDHHAAIAEPILRSCRIGDEDIEKIKSLILKKDMASSADMQVLEDVICLVFLEHYCDEFAAKHDRKKVIDILRKTMKKMSPRAIEAVGTIGLSDELKSMINEASTNH